MLFPKGRKPREADDTMTNKEEQEEIDLALDAALDELDDEEVNESPPSVEDVASISAKPAADSTAENPSPSTAEAKKAAPVVMGPPRPPVVEDGDPEKMISDMMEQMLGMQQQGGDASDDFIGQLMQGMQSQISSEIENLDAATPPPSTPPKQSTPVQVQAPAPVAPASTKGPVKSSEGGVDEAISSLLEGMASEKLSDDGIGGSPSMPGETDLLESLMQGLGGGDTEGMNADTVIDGMMEQLMAKDLMYEPIKQFATNFPPWLEERKATMSEEEYARRRKQCEGFQKIVHVYDTEPGNTAKIMELMQENQDYGELPTEFTREVAPGLEFDENGMPKMGDGNPFAGNEECRVM